MATNSEMLTKVRAAIEALLTGGAVQRYVVAGKDITKFTLRELKELEDYYSAKVASETSTRTYANFLST